MIRKTTEARSWIKFNNLGLAIGMTLKFNTRGVITKSHKVLEATFYVCRRKIWWGGGFATTIMFKKIRLTTILPIHVYIIRINHRLLLKIKDGYKLELLTPETMMLFGSSKKSTDETKNREKSPSLKVVEAVLVQSNLVDNQYQQKPEVLYTCTPNKLYTYC